jgi:transposase
MRASRTHKKYDPTFRDDAVDLVRRSGRSIGAVASDLGIPEGTLWSWYYRAEMARKGKKVPGKRGSAMVVDPAAESAEAKLLRLERENAQLRKEVDSLKMDRAILKKAAAFVCHERDR